MSAPDTGRPGPVPLSSTYGVRMRNATEAERGAWATYTRAAREQRGMSQTALAQRTGIDRVTIWRWENSKQRPDDPDVIARWASALAIDANEAMAAAGLRPGVTPPREPARRDEAIEMIRQSSLPDRVKRELIKHVQEQRQQDEQRRVEDLRRTIRLAGGSV